MLTSWIKPILPVGLLVLSVTSCADQSPRSREPSAVPLQVTIAFPDGIPAAEGSIQVAFTNRSADPVFVGADVRADPGFWLRPVRQKLHVFRIPPDTTLPVDVPYQFAKVSPGAALRIRAGVVEEVVGGSLAIPEPVLIRSMSFGSSPMARSFMERFDSIATPHLTLYALRGSPASPDLAAIAEQREAAALTIGNLLTVNPPAGIQMVFYPDSATKTTDTRHIGSGWANGSVIVEIYNDSIRVDPYHELTHIIAARLGGPPAWLDEGLATYLSERLGADALALLGAPGQPVRVESCRLSREGLFIPLDMLLAVEAFGGDSVPSAPAYAESAALVEYLMETLGIERFRTVYRQLLSGMDAVPVERNRQTFEALAGASLDEFEEAYRAWLAAGCG